MRVAEMARKTGLTRQWLNRLADKGGIPGCGRKANGRLRIQDGPELQLWLRRTRNKISSSRAARARIHERAFARVTKNLSRITNESNRRVDLKAVQILQDKILDLKKTKARDFYTSGEVAKATGYNRRHVSRIASKIPGALYGTNGWRFEKTEDLHLWIRQSRIANRERGKPKDRERRGAVTINSVLRKLYDVTRGVVENRPIADWSLQECNAFMSETEPLLEIADDVRRRWDRLSSDDSKS